MMNYLSVRQYVFGVSIFPLNPTCSPSGKRHVESSLIMHQTQSITKHTPKQCYCLFRDFWFNAGDIKKKTSRQFSEFISSAHRKTLQWLEADFQSATLPCPLLLKEENNKTVTVFAPDRRWSKTEERKQSSTHTDSVISNPTYSRGSSFMKHMISWQLFLQTSTEGVCPYLDVWRHMESVPTFMSLRMRERKHATLICTVPLTGWIPTSPVVLWGLLSEPGTCHAGTPLWGLRCRCERGLVETDSPCCEKPHCGHCPHFRCGWRGWGRWLCGEWRPWFGHQRSHGASLEKDNNRVREEQRLFHGFYKH